VDGKDRKPMGKAGRTWDEIQKSSVAKDERTLQKQIAALLTQRDIWFNRSRMDKRTTNTRFAPDFLFFWNGRGFAFEAKIGKSEPTEGQLDCHCQMRRNGWLVFVVRSVQEAREFLDGRPQ
jgi:hypothetical protein